MNKAFRTFDRAVERLSHCAGVIAGLCILAVAFIVVYEIIMRGVFNSPTEWVLEISTYLIIVAGFLGLAVTLRKRGHIKVDFVQGRLNEQTRRVLEIITTSLSLMLFCIFFVESAELVRLSHEFNKLSPSILRFPLWIPQMSPVIGSGLLALELIRQLWSAAIELRRGGNEN